MLAIVQKGNLTIDAIQVYEPSTTQGIATLPVELFQIPGVQALNLVDNKMKELPADIQNLTNLTQLNLVGNQFSSIPEELGHLTKLSDLLIGEGHGHHRREVRHTLQKLPQSIKDLKALERIWIEDCGLVETCDVRMPK